MLNPKSRSAFGIGLAVGLAVGVAMLAGALAALAVWGPTRLIIPQTALHAEASQAGETLAVATGLIDEDVEGLFVLDFVTGDLRCMVMGYRTGVFNGLFETNVLKDLGVDPNNKRPSYLMVAGLSNFAGRTTGASPAMSVVYVVDANTGRFAAYSLPWRTELARSGRPQQGPLVLLQVENARRALIRG